MGLLLLSVLHSAWSENLRHRSNVSSPFTLEFLELYFKFSSVFSIFEQFDNELQPKHNFSRRLTGYYLTKLFAWLTNGNKPGCDGKLRLHGSTFDRLKDQGTNQLFIRFAWQDVISTDVSSTNFYRIFCCNVGIRFVGEYVYGASYSDFDAAGILDTQTLSYGNVCIWMTIVGCYA